jgi:hypothetical protein
MAARKCTIPVTVPQPATRRSGPTGAHDPANCTRSAMAKLSLPHGGVVRERHPCRLHDVDKPMMPSSCPRWRPETPCLPGATRRRSVATAAPGSRSSAHPEGGSGEEDLATIWRHSEDAAGTMPVHPRGDEHRRLLEHERDFGGSHLAVEATVRVVGASLSMLRRRFPSVTMRSTVIIRRSWAPPRRLTRPPPAWRMRAGVSRLSTRTER